MQAARFTVASRLRHATSTLGQKTLRAQSTFQVRGPARLYATDNTANVSPPDYLDQGELKVFQIVKEGLKPTKLEVQDVSGGCGSMYALDIVSEEFRDLTLIKQHRLVKKLLGEEMKSWHGIQLKTKAP